MEARFITFEGIEGSGKSTVARKVSEWLEGAGIRTLVTREPGGKKLSEEIREMLLDASRGPIEARTELLLYVASRAQLVGEVIRPALEGGVTVLCDRFMDASVAYQGWARGLGEGLVDSLNTFAVGECVPERTLLLDLPVEAGFSRGPERRESEGVRARDRLEREDREFHERVREGYLRLAERHPERVIVIDASAPLDRVIADIFGNLAPLFGVEFE